MEGRCYIDGFAGVLNYGHNHPAMKQANVEYSGKNGVVYSLDTATSAKETWLRTYQGGVTTILCNWTRI